MAGLLRNFMKFSAGAGAAAADIAQGNIQEKILAARNDRLAKQRSAEIKQEQEFRSTENQKTREFNEEQGRLDRKSRERMAQQRHGDSTLSPFGRELRDLKAAGVSDEEALKLTVNKYVYGQSSDPKKYILDRTNELMTHPLTGMPSGMSREEAMKQASSEYRQAIQEAQAAINNEDVMPEVKTEKQAPVFNDDQMKQLRQRLPGKSDEEIMQMYNQFKSKTPGQSTPEAAAPEPPDPTKEQIRSLLKQKEEELSALEKPQQITGAQLRTASPEQLQESRASTDKFTNLSDGIMKDIQDLKYLLDNMGNTDQTPINPRSGKIISDRINRMDDIAGRFGVDYRKQLAAN